MANNQYFFCWLCDQHMPISFKQVHHVVLQAARGTDKGTVDLCGGCHGFVHLLGNLLLHNQLDTAEIVLNQYLQSSEARKKAMTLASEIVKVTLLKKEGDPEYQPETATLSVTVPFEIKNRFALAAKEQGTSMEGLLESLVWGVVAQSHPRPSIQYAAELDNAYQRWKLR